ncbi:formate dehydrogenase subunit gamma [Malaciobacter molluscorum LMG 25693]|uniref:Formate dehydrogenase subunit gamma n=2 Tax=Malaciobacter molluscorum LMG 25693 TaxID=870501 RepID=A0A2G1DLV4_9BACT|nr:formate dehydrogenase subunit gamma [Malaciobacter molluscorum]PHO19487.1 formate dehydrogenase subunit gamma [Malaciobacter molluscorum LMG 25693]RXJ96533.1 formate dehydrogenase subunit gamma [Malaciobacter molluscorum]
MMKKYILLLLFVLASVAIAADESSAIFGKDIIPNILAYDKAGSLHLGKWFTLLQGKYFSIAFLAIAFGVPAVFLVHYLIIGPMIFSHDRKKIHVFTIFHRFIHWLAGFSFIVLIPTGFVMVFGTFFGGGEFVRVCKELHAISTVFFAISVLPMLFMWLKEMLPTSDDIKWLMILGGYLNKRKDPIPAGKFNAGQKMWFWTCTFGGIIMIITGAIMYFQDFKLDIIASLGLSQIDLLRASAIVHNVLGMAVAALFMTHVYMSVFAIKGAIHSMITGYKEEEEVEILHSTYYKKLKEKKEI